MYEEQFPVRLAQLRGNKGVSARDMSLSIGQNAGYINNIETGKALPSMAGFFYICEFLEITPCEFFDFECANPKEMEALTGKLKQLSQEQIEAVSTLVDGILNK